MFLVCVCVCGGCKRHVPLTESRKTGVEQQMLMPSDVDVFKLPRRCRFLAPSDVNKPLILVGVGVMSWRLLWHIVQHL